MDTYCTAASKNEGVSRYEVSGYGAESPGVVVLSFCDNAATAADSSVTGSAAESDSTASVFGML